MLNQSLKSGDGSCQADTHSHSIPERLWQRQWRCSRSKCRTSQRPSASPCPPLQRRKRDPPNPPSRTKTLQCRMLRPGSFPPPQRLWGSHLALLFRLSACTDVGGHFLLRGLSDSADVNRMVVLQKAADVWEKDVWEFQAKSGSSGSCCLFLYFLGKIAVQEMSGKTLGSPRHPSSRHPRPSESCPATMTMAGVPSQLAAANCQPACSIQCLAPARGNASVAAPSGSPLPGSWTPTTENRQVKCTCSPPSHLPGSMTINPCAASLRRNARAAASRGSPLPGSWTLTRENRQVRCPCPPHSHLPGSLTISMNMGTVDVIPYMTRVTVGYQAQTRPYPALCHGRTPGVSAHALEGLCACQGQEEHDLLCLVKLPGSLHSQYLCSHRGTSGGYGHTNPLSESPGGLSGNPLPPALPVCHLGLPGSAEMADSRMASPAAAPGRLSIASVGMRHVEKNNRTGTQILPGSISGFYHREQYQAARHVLERCFRARYVEIVDLRPLKDARSYPDLRGHMGWHPTNVLINMHDRSLRDIAARIVEALTRACQQSQRREGHARRLSPPPWLQSR